MQTLQLRRILAVVLLCAVALCLFGCSKKVDVPAETTKAAEEVAETAEETVEEVAEEAEAAAEETVADAAAAVDEAFDEAPKKVKRVVRKKVSTD